jgi:hypothetical protein
VEPADAQACTAHPPGCFTPLTETGKSASWLPTCLTAIRSA